MKRLAVIGAGNWGTALAIMAARAGHEVSVWSRNSHIVAAINRQHLNPVYLQDTVIPEVVCATIDLQTALRDVELVIMAAPSHAARDVLLRMSSSLRPQMLIVSATKGIEVDTGKRISEVVAEVLEEKFRPRFACMSGPSFAREVVENHPTAIVAASANPQDSRLVQSELSFQNLRIYTNDDLVGTELGGAVKNVIAIAAGMVAGLGLGSNSMAALITRGLAEITRLATQQGGRLETLMGLAGLGDLVLTCTGTLSRNRFVGQELGKGRRLVDICAGMKEIAEGVRTAAAVKQLSARFGVEMPIVDEVYSVLYEHKPAPVAVHTLMTRPLRGEFDSF
jgi:glycerol-3-phosphate dehydrogenase (NAD(P)+)